MVQSGTGWYRVVQNGSECCRGVQGCAEWYRVAEWHRVLVLSAAGSDPPAPFVPPAWLVPSIIKVVQNGTDWYYRVVQNGSECCRGVQRCAEW